MYVLRGVSGSGKSTKALELAPKENIFSTDEYFMVGGKYFFDSGKLSKAHAWNRERVYGALKSGVSPVVVDNTNTQSWEAEPYVKMALAHGYKIEFVEPDTSWAKNADELAKRNKHGVPKAAIVRMLQRYQPMDKFKADLIGKGE